MDKIADFYIIFYVNKNGLYDFTVIKAVSLKDAVAVSKAFAKATKCKILGVCLDCFKTFKLCNDK
jgi:hypothetical protein